MLVIENPGTYREDRQVLSQVLKREIVQMHPEILAEFISNLVEKRAESGILTVREIGNLVYLDIEEGREEADE